MKNMNKLYVDVILWIFLQNMLTLSYEYFEETDEYNIFESSILCSSTQYILSKTDLFDEKKDGHFIYINFFNIAC